MDREAGTLGVVGLGAATLGTVALGGDMWFEGFAAPWLAEVAPGVFTVDRTGSLVVTAGVTSAALFALGWALFGIAGLRARVFPMPVSLAIVAGGLIGVQAGQPPWGVALGLAVAVLGGWLIHADRAEGRLPETSPELRV